MICSFVLNLKPITGGERIKKYTNYKYIFIDLLNSGMENENFKFINVSNFLTRDEDIDENKKYSIKISCIKSETIIKVLQLYFFKKLNNETIKIGNTDFYISNIYHDNIWSKQLDLNSFFEKPFKKEIKLKFISPTFFKLGTKYISSYDPNYIFRNILSKLKKSSIASEFVFSKDLNFSGIKVKDNFLREVKIKEYETNGIIGEITYYVEDTNDEELLENLNFLLYFSFFSGVGYGCEKGYGQTVIID